MTTPRPLSTAIRNEVLAACRTCLLYTSDAADDVIDV